MKKIHRAFIIVLLLAAGCTYAQTETARSPKDFVRDYDAYVRKMMERVPDIPGIAIAVIKDDKPVFVRAYGMADKEAGIKADTDTLFYIASSTKSFTALAAQLLDREGKIKLDDPIAKYSGGIQFKNALPDKITVRDLLIHTSGLRNEPLVNRMAFTGQTDPADMNRVFAEATTYVDARYGKYNYDNLGYNIYAVLLRNHLRIRWQDLLQERIFGPMGMKHTTAYVSHARTKKWALAAPYVYDAVAGKVQRSSLSKTDGNMQSAGGMFASISDIGRWLNMQMNAGRLAGKQIFPADIIRAAHTGYTQTVRDNPPFSGNGEYGLGWQIGKYRDERVIYHHGGFPGYRSHISFLPDKRIAVAVLVNDGFAGVRAADILATYGYDWWLRAPDMEQAHGKQLQELVDGYAQGTARMKASAAERSKRRSQLTQPPASYAGTYRSEIYGTIEITAAGNDLAVRMGNMNAIATPFTEKETIRVELTPGQGETIKFARGPDGKISSLSYARVVFAKVAP